MGITEPSHRLQNKQRKMLYFQVQENRQTLTSHHKQRIYDLRICKNLKILDWVL